MIFIHLFVFM